MIDFIDFGYGKGGGYCLCKVLGGKTGFSIDISMSKCNTAHRNKHVCIQCDALKCNFPYKSVKFATMLHFLEHLPSMDAANLIISNCSRFVTDFVIIEGPSFSFDEYLAKYGLRFYWSNWTGHSLHIKEKSIIEMLKSNGFTFYAPFVAGTVKDSNNTAIHSMTSPIDQFQYDATKHPPKKYVKFNNPIYKNFMLIAFFKRPSIDFIKKIASFRKNFVAVDDL